MHLYMAEEADPMRIVRSAIYGGELPLIECVLKAFTIALHQTLSDGYVGRDENVWTIVHRRFPHLFSGWVKGANIYYECRFWLQHTYGFYSYAMQSYSFIFNICARVLL